MGADTSKEVVSDTLTIYRKKDLFIPDPWNYGIAFGFTSLVKQVIAMEKPDDIVVNKILFWTSLSAIALRLSGKKVILLTDAFVGMTWWPRGLIPQMGAAIYAWTLGWLIMLCAKRIVTFHPQPPSLLKRLGIAQKTEVIPTGIDPAPYGKRMDHKEITVTYVGRLESVKGVEDFLAAAVSVSAHHPNVVLQVAGFFKDPHPLVEQYKHQVKFLGLYKDIPELLGSTDIFVLPSYSEGLSNALMEAMASGCACIASEVGGNRYLIQNGVSGLLFPAGDREALAAHLRRLMEDPAKRKAMGEAARKRIEELFSWKVVGEKYRSLLELRRGQ
jgi:glycosyltransferase involved in cell wall biosynthesis